MDTPGKAPPPLCKCSSFPARQTPSEWRKMTLSPEYRSHFLLPPSPHPWPWRSSLTPARLLPVLPSACSWWLVINWLILCPLTPSVPSRWLLHTWYLTFESPSALPSGLAGPSIIFVGFFAVHSWAVHLSPMMPGISFVLLLVLFSRQVVSDYSWPHGLQHARLPCPSPSPGVCPSSCPLNRWCQLTISFSATPFSSCPQSFTAPESFPVSQFFTSGGQSIGMSASESVLPMNIRGWLPLGLTGLISFHGFLLMFRHGSREQGALSMKSSLESWPWDGWMASLTRWMWVWVNSGSGWWTGRPGVLWFMGSWRVGQDWATEMNWPDLNLRLASELYRKNPLPK